ncbi:MAG TPA: lysoplasmalogenase family protein, partial [Anaerolineaceae bacterium]|nr:lysoplasmalogenase family protein [Anaerolineaceae bacterium]
MFTWPFFLAAGFALLDWASTWKGWKKRLYIAKPATLLFLIVWTLLLTRWQGDMLFYGIALVFSLAGDILLMLNPRFFLYGLVAFLLTHVFYLVAFNQTAAIVNVGVMLIAVLVGIVAAR